MSYESITHSNVYYKLHGFTYVQAPWLVEARVSDITKPSDKKNLFVRDKVLVASGEQSFIQLINESKLEACNYYQTTTPCFRDEIEDELHHMYFMKTELIYYEMVEMVESSHPQKSCSSQKERLQMVVDKMVEICLNFFGKYLPVISISLEPESSQHYYRFDIITDDDRQIELGSYGIREHQGKVWIYGTGCAEPRLSHAVRLHRQVGYHLALIPKTKDIGSAEKIIEEYEEWLDSVAQKTKVMELVELSDLIGAIDLYIKKQYNMSINDLIAFSNITQRAFINGTRK